MSLAVESPVVFHMRIFEVELSKIVPFDIVKHGDLLFPEVLDEMAREDVTPSKLLNVRTSSFSP